MKIKLLISISCDNENQEVSARDKLRISLDDFRKSVKESDGNQVFYSLISYEGEENKKREVNQSEPIQQKLVIDDLDRAALENYDKKYTELDWEHRKIIKNLINGKKCT